MDEWAEIVRVRVWDRLLRTGLPASEDTEQLHKLWAGREQLGEHNCLALRVCLACVTLAQEGSLALREELRIFLAYYLSRDGSALIADVPRPRSAQELTLEWLRGRELSWSEIFQLFGRTANPDRIRKLLSEHVERLL
jgi:hypothetical protein